MRLVKDEVIAAWAKGWFGVSIVVKDTNAIKEENATIQIVILTGNRLFENIMKNIAIWAISL